MSERHRGHAIVCSSTEHGDALSDKSKIEWTDATWNPVRGCQKISPGCKHCYAETFAERFRGVPAHPYEFGFDLRLIPTKLLEPLSWSSPRTVFVNSMSDLFQDGVPEAYIGVVAQIMLATPWHTYQVLTKRADRMRAVLGSSLLPAASAENIWWGVSVEDRRYGVPRIDALRGAPARTRFLSVEPLLEDIGHVDLQGIHWVIVGGESGPGARPMSEAWVQSIRRQSRDSNVPFFFKQWGGFQKKKAGRMLDGRTFDEMPARSTAPMPDRLARQALAAQLQADIVDPLDRGGLVVPVRRLKRARNLAPTVP